MVNRIDYQKQSSDLFPKFVAVSMAFGQSAIEHSIRNLAELRASQMNGGAFCIDRHAKLVAGGSPRSSARASVPRWPGLRP